MTCFEEPFRCMSINLKEKKNHFFHALPTKLFVKLHDFLLSLSPSSTAVSLLTCWKIALLFSPSPPLYLSSLVSPATVTTLVYFCLIYALSKGKASSPSKNTRVVFWMVEEIPDSAYTRHAQRVSNSSLCFFILKLRNSRNSVLLSIL